MLRPKSIALVNQRRTLRALYAQTQAYPYAAKLNPTQSLTDSAHNMLGLTGSDGATGTAAIWPGGVLTLSDQGGVVEYVEVADDDSDRPFGLSANYVGGQMDELNGNAEIGVWRGRGGVFEVLSPVFASAVDGNSNMLGVASSSTVPGQLDELTVTDSDAGTTLAAARIISALSANAIIVELVVGG
jgi:hypothetical protein